MLWRDGSTRLLDYRPAGGAPLLVVPSLINRAYILDLAPGRSLLRHLAEAGPAAAAGRLGRAGRLRAPHDARRPCRAAGSRRR